MRRSTNIIHRNLPPAMPCECVMHVGSSCREAANHESYFVVLMRTASECREAGRTWEALACGSEGSGVVRASCRNSRSSPSPQSSLNPVLATYAAKGECQHCTKRAASLCRPSNRRLFIEAARMRCASCPGVHRGGPHEVRLSLTKRSVTIIGPASYVELAKIERHIRDTDIVVRPNVPVSGAGRLLLPRGSGSRVDVVYHHGAILGEAVPRDRLSLASREGVAAEARPHLQPRVVNGSTGGGRARATAVDFASAHSALTEATLDAYRAAGVRQVVVAVECCNGARVRNYDCLATLEKARVPRPGSASRAPSQRGAAAIGLRRLTLGDTGAEGGLRSFRTGLKLLLDVCRQRPARVSLYGYDFYQASADGADDQHGFEGYYKDSRSAHSPWHNETAEIHFFARYLAASRCPIRIDTHLANVVRRVTGRVFAPSLRL